MFVSLMVELLLMLAPLLMLEPLVVLELPVALVPVLRFIPLVLLAPPALVVLEPLMLELRFMLLALSDAGATAPPADNVSVVLALLLLLHAATAATAAKIAMHFMKSSEGSNYPGSLRDTSARQSLVDSCLAEAISGPRCPGCAKGATSAVAPFYPSCEEVGYGFFPIFIAVSFFIDESIFDVVIALSCFVVSIMAGAGLMAGAATTAVSAGAESLALHAAIARTAATTARRFIETLLLEGGMGSTLRPSTSVGAMPGASGG